MRGQRSARSGVVFARARVFFFFLRRGLWWFGVRRTLGVLGCFWGCFGAGKRVKRVHF